MFDEVIGGSFQRAFCVVFFFCSARALVETAGPVNDSAINTFISLLVIQAENRSTTARIKIMIEIARLTQGRKMQVAFSFLEFDVTAASGDALRAVLSLHAVARSQRACRMFRLGCLQLRVSQFLTSHVLFNFADLAIGNSSHAYANY